VRHCVMHGGAGAQFSALPRVMKARHRPQALWRLADYSPVQQLLPACRVWCASYTTHIQRMAHNYQSTSQWQRDQHIIWLHLVHLPHELACPGPHLQPTGH
jgi:hypothetical protein